MCVCKDMIKMVIVNSAYYAHRSALILNSVCMVKAHTLYVYLVIKNYKTENKIALKNSVLSIYVVGDVQIRLRNVVPRIFISVNT